VPPLAKARARSTGVNWSAGWGPVTPKVRESGPLTVRWKELLAVALFASVTVTVKSVLASAWVGVPVMAPSPGLKLRPLGSAGEIE
jgi:hypothetical protein